MPVNLSLRPDGHASTITDSGLIEQSAKTRPSLISVAFEVQYDFRMIPSVPPMLNGLSWTIFWADSQGTSPGRKATRLSVGGWNISARYIGVFVGMAATEETITEREITSGLVARMVAKVGTVFEAIYLVKLNINIAGAQEAAMDGNSETDSKIYSRSHSGHVDSYST